MNLYNQSEKIEALAAEIGDNIYIDVAKWHLYLSNAHLHTVLAEKIYPLLNKNSLTDNKIKEILASISIQLGGGKLEVSLAQLLPKQCEQNLINIVQDFQENM
jgi:hypothetical protein